MSALSFNGSYFPAKCTLSVMLELCEATKKAFRNLIWELGGHSRQFHMLGKGETGIPLPFFGEV